MRTFSDEYDNQEAADFNEPDDSWEVVQQFSKYTPSDND